ncbi:DUF5522 domain-containing protein [Polyangium aurulentum]|uniref:DUF5522 domain-containing protein n=1 Tax=Polyangium aurulentum TaxID=2567896 RepID=UPI0010AE7FB3|nr:DUF5522 domain-containing protein [Polyangium aurulentum]UQA61991.1 hypothetical protein E8A73_016560 [Polyangium aurulentum]
MSSSPPKFRQLVEGIDYYREGQKVVFTSAYHLKRGYCCHSKCRHCPYGLASAPETFTLAIDARPVPVLKVLPGKDGSSDGDAGET